MPQSMAITNDVNTQLNKAMRCREAIFKTRKKSFITPYHP
jgi:hypothetical protein